MSKYQNDVCPVCNRKFGADSDIVVCPECGTPHHRECYAANGSCANASLHTDGFSWVSAEEKLKTEINARAEAEESARSRQHNTQNTGNAGNAQPFGVNPELRGMQNYSIPDFNSEEAKKPIHDGVSEKELFAFLGQRGIYYIFIFKNMLKTGKKTSFNIFSAFFFPAYQFFRRMTVAGIIMSLVMLILNFPSVLGLLLTTEFGKAFADSFEPYLNLIYNVGDFFLYLTFAVRILLALFSDYFYMRWTIKKIKTIRACYGEQSDDYYRALAEKGNPSIPIMLIGVLAASLVSTAACLGVMMIV